MCVHVRVCASLHHPVSVRVSGCVNRRGGVGGGYEGTAGREVVGHGWGGARRGVAGVTLFWLR